MATRISIPGFLIENNNDFDINTFLIGQGFTPVTRERTPSFWIITITENLNPGQQTALSVQLRNALDLITFTVI